MKSILYYFLCSKGSHVTWEQSKASKSQWGPIVCEDPELVIYLLSVPEGPAHVRGKLGHGEQGRHFCCEMIKRAEKIRMGILFPTLEFGVFRATSVM